MSALSPLALLFVLVSVSSALDVRYVKPNEPSPTSCPGQPCLTLDQYAEQTDVYFTTGATFLFLAGNHSLSTTLRLTDTSDLTLTSKDSDIYIMYSNGATIVCRNVTKLRIEKLNFVLYSDSSEHGSTGFNFSNSKINISELAFFGNGRSGHAIEASESKIIVNGSNFSKNKAVLSGGAIYANRSNITLNRNNFSENNAHLYGGAIYALGSNVDLKGNLFSGNTADHNGGAICVRESTIILNDFRAEEVGAITSNTSTIHANDANVFNGRVTEFLHNSAVNSGGALSAVESKIFFKNTVIFTSNTARDGGAIFFNVGTTLTLEPHTNVTTSHNRATEHGGVIFYEDTPTPIQCKTIFKFDDNLLPQCPLQVTELYSDKISTSLNSYNDSAGKGGSCLYGGLLDKCQMGTHNMPMQNVPYKTLKDQVFNFKSSTPEVTSEPYYLCFCTNASDYDCSIRVENRQIYRGQEIKVSFMVLAQGCTTTTATLLTARMSSTASLKLNQSIQTLYPQCNTVSYNLYSTQSQENLALYVDGPCRDTGLAKAIVNVTLLPCPDAFIQYEDRCICDERLQVYGAECIIAEQSYIKRKAGSRFWMSAKYNESHTYQGLILFGICLADYCESDSVDITLDNLDIQCAYNRSGVLCGACATNYSLMLGSSKCQVCSNTYLTLLVPFAAAGIALVVFLTFFRLTVATGMINSLILYANIIQVNKSLFWPDQTGNFLTVFIAWLNLDLGIQTCFYDSMDTYAQTWLQFAFPVYVWSIIGLIVLTSQYSITVSKLIGSNPIAVLATLLLMSYTKILNIIITVYCSIDLDYPDNKTVTVWHKDANVPYLRSKHLILAVVTLLVFVFLFIPYTLLLLLGHKLYRYSNRKGFRWLDKIKPLLDSYYAPYKFHTRYWAGFLLLVRCALYIAFSFECPTKILFTIVCTFTAIGMIAGYLRVYSNPHTNIIEVSLYLNLVILSVATLADANSPALVYTLVGIAFATMVGILVYHFHISYTAKSAVWKKYFTLKAVWKKFFILRDTISTGVADRAAYTPLLTPNPHNVDRADYTSLLTPQTVDRAAYTPLLTPTPQRNMVTQTVIDIREQT